MVRLLAPFLIALACLFAACAPALAQGNCPQCDLPPQCRGEKRGQPASERPECQREDDDDDDEEEEEEPAPPPPQDVCEPGSRPDPADPSRCVPRRPEPPGPVGPPDPICDNCKLPRKCRIPEEFEMLPAQVRRKCRPLDIVVESDIDFGRVVLLRQGSGSVMVDLDTGQKLLEGDVEDIGGVTITGEVSLTGTPFEPVRIDFPWSVGMRDGSAQQAEIRDFQTDLAAFPTLDTHGELRFRFTGKLMLDQKTNASGTLRGRVPISVSYFN